MQIDINRGILARQRLNYIFKELFRKSIHICSSFVPLFLGIAYWPVIAGLVILVSFYSVCEFLRLKGKTIPLISKVTEIAARKRDENKFVLGPVTLVFGILLAALFLPLDCARVGIFCPFIWRWICKSWWKIYWKNNNPWCSWKNCGR